MAPKMTLHTMLGNYPNTLPLKKKEILSDLIDFDFVDVKGTTIKAAVDFFKPLVRESAFDVSEIAIITYLQAKAYAKPYTLIPAVILGRGQHHTIAYNSERGPMSPADLEGRRVGIRAYTVTTGAWVRGMLSDDYGVDLNKVRWVSFEDPHVAEFKDPPIVERAPAGKTMLQMLLDGELDAAVVGDTLPDPRLKHLIPDAENVAVQWARTNGGVPINHMVVVRESITRSRPDVVKELFRLLYESKLAAKRPDTGTALDPLRFGVEPMRRTLEIIIDFAFRQGEIPRRFSVDELFDDTTRALSI